jgi:hypothetical protein
MKRLACLIFALPCFAAMSQKSPSPRPVLLEQLKSTHNVKNWFVPVNTALEGLTAEQAAWKDKGNHSAGQLAYHLLFWNERVLRDFKGEKNADFSGNNEETFDKFDPQQWAGIVKRLDQVLTDIEKWVEAATEEQLAKHAATIANISTHNSYHTGQIISVRKAQGSWDPEKGVK